MTNSPNQPESWETELRDAASTIPDAAPDVVDGMEALRHALVEHTIGLYEALGWPADIDPDDALAKAAELRAENDRLFVRWKMSRAEVDRLRSRIADAHKVADRLQNNYLLPIMADALRDALDGPQPDPAREAALNEMAYESARETTDFAVHWPINTRDKDSVRYVQCAYDSFPGLEGGRCISNATDGPYCKPHADAIAEYDATNRKEK